MTPFSLLIKPTSADCNLHCEYCFYLDHNSLYPETKVHRMSDSVLERMIASYMALEQSHYVFSWQGGEPTLMGLDFFQKVIKLQTKHRRKGAGVTNTLQTNATLIDDNFARFLYQNKFLVGVSLDGPENVHNKYRKTTDGKGTHSRVLKGIEILKRNKVELNILTLVNSANVHMGKEIFNYLYDAGFKYQQYIPCVEFNAHDEIQPYAVDGPAWGKFLCDVFDAWLGKDPLKTSVRLFDAILLLMLDGTYHLCRMAGNCCQYCVVEYNGDVYPCDFFVLPDLWLGNIMKTSWQELLSSSRYQKFGALKTAWHQQCSNCEYLIFCSGDCLKHRIYNGHDAQNLSWLCEGWKIFFAYSLPEFKKLALTILQQRKTNGYYPYGQAKLKLDLLLKTGRNDPCFCGSGKKYKKCHLGQR